MFCTYTAKHHDDTEVRLNVDISCCKKLALWLAVKLLCFRVFAMIKLFPLICAAAYWNAVIQAFFHFPQNSTELGHLFLYAKMLTHYFCNGNIWQFIFYIVSECLVCCIRFIPIFKVWGGKLYLVCLAILVQLLIFFWIIWQIIFYIEIFLKFIFPFFFFSAVKF